MKAWIDREWSNTFTNPHNSCSSGKILVADVHTAQQTEAVKTALGKSTFHLAARAEYSP